MAAEVCDSACSAAVGLVIPIQTPEVLSGVGARDLNSTDDALNYQKVPCCAGSGHISPHWPDSEGRRPTSLLSEREVATFEVKGVLGHCEVQNRPSVVVYECFLPDEPTDW